MVRAGKVNVYYCWIKGAIYILGYTSGNIPDAIKNSFEFKEINC